jgi:hypothetical protein
MSDSNIRRLVSGKLSVYGPERRNMSRGRCRYLDNTLGGQP